jgi:hypothetical protein
MKLAVARWRLVLLRASLCDGQLLFANGNRALAN